MLDGALIIRSSHSMLYSNQKHKDSRRNEVTDLPEHVKLPQHSSTTIMSCLTWKLKCQLVYVCVHWHGCTSHLFYLGSSLYKCHCHAHPLLRQCIMAGGPTGLWTPLPHWEIVSLLYQWSHTRIPWAFTQLNKQESFVCGMTFLSAKCREGEAMATPIISLRRKKGGQGEDMGSGFGAIG